MDQGPTGKYIQELIDVHVSFYEKEEKENFDKARRYFQGKFGAVIRGKASGKQDRAICTKNMIYAVADTAVSALIGSNPSVAANGKNPRSKEMQDAVTAVIEADFRSNQLRRLARTVLLDGVLYGRGIFKQKWDKATDTASIDVCDVASVFFDLETRIPKKIAYWLHCTPITMDAFNERVKAGLYSQTDLETGSGYEIRREDRPKWMNGNNSTTNARTAISAVQKWVVVWEYYDIKKKMAYHYVPAVKALVLKSEMSYCPFSLFEMNQNGEDCRGLSEVQLILPQQETMNDVLTHWKRIVYLLIPRILFNAGLIDADELAKAVASAAGAFVPVTLKIAGAAVADLSTAFKDMPLPTMPREIVEFVNRQETDAAFVSALMDMARGQAVAPGTTATAVAVMDQHNRNRLTNREGNLAEVLEEVAKKDFWLNQNRLKGIRSVELPGGKEQEVRSADLVALDYEWEMAAWSAMKSNPLVMLDTLKEFLPIMAATGFHDLYRVWEHINNLASIPQDTILSKEQIEADAKVAQEAAQEAMAMRGAPPKGPIPQQEPGAQPGELLPQSPPAEIPGSILQQAGLPTGA